MRRDQDKRARRPEGGASTALSSPGGNGEALEMSEAGPSRIRYPPPAAQRRTRTRADGRELSTVHHSNSSSSLFWRGEGAGTQGSMAQVPTEPDARPPHIHDPIMADALRSLPRPSERRAPRIGDEGGPLERKASRASGTSTTADANMGEKTTAPGVPSIASSKSVLGGWKDWLSTKTGGGGKAPSTKRSQAGRRLDKKLRRAEKRSRRKKERAGRESRRSASSSSGAENDSDSDVVVTINEPDQVARPPLDVPPPNETTADALSKVASRKAPKLHFAPEERKIRRKDLPVDYEQGDLYRGIDDYVKASRDGRRRIKRQERKKGGRGSRASSRGSRSSISKSSLSSRDSSSSSSSDGSSSTGSSSSSASGRLTMARLRAFFGDSSSSSSSSSSSDSSSTSTSTSGDDSRSSRSSSSNPSFRLFRRRRASRAGSDSDSESNTPATPRTPALNFQIKGGAQRRRRRKAAKRNRAQEKQLIEQGKIPPRPSRKARKKAKLAREQAGGITEYTLFTPTPLSSLGYVEKHHPNSARPPAPNRGFTQQRVDVHNPPNDAADRVLQTVSFVSVKERLHALRRHRRQVENAEGDLGLAGVEKEGKKEAEPVKGGNGEGAKDHGGRDEDSEIVDFEEGDLALPPPAMDLPPAHPRDSSSSSRKDRERRGRDWHMSDLPLTPHVQMATDFARGFELASPRTVLNSVSDAGRGHPVLSFQPSGNDGQQASSEEPSSSANTRLPSGGHPPERESHAAWWLDINCPTYRDMTELSKMFPLHPLTVEDVLQQDTREKVEVFESLNYYFVVVRAIDEKYFRYTSASAATSSDQQAPTTKAEGERGTEEEEGDMEMKELKRQRPRVEIVEGVGGKEGLEGVSVGAVNVYLIVFSHGVISFHFEDISKHTNRLRNRLLDLTQPVELTSDWIAHGLFDSIVDAFFPLLSFLETEVEDIEQLTSEPLPQTRRDAVMARRRRVKGVEKGERGADRLPVSFVHEEQDQVVLRLIPWVPMPRMAAHLLPHFLVSHRTRVSKREVQDGPQPQPRSFIQRVFGLNRKQARVTAFLSNSAQGQSSMLRRITDTRKITTGLSRLLTPKNDSVRGLRKRLVELRGPSMSVTEMTIYMGDVHDHIVSLLSHLASSDHRLGDIHFSYLSSIRINNNRVSHSTDEILVVLATITVTILSTLCFISIWSLNATIPHNILRTSDHHWFGGVVAFSCCIPILVSLRTWHWLRQSKQKTAARRAVR